MTRYKENSLAVALGVLAGVALGYYLNSNEGRKMTKKAKRKMKNMERDFATTLKNTSDQIVDKAHELLDGASQAVDKTANYVKSKKDDVVEVVEEEIDSTQESFKKGVSRAESKLTANRAKAAKIAKS